MRRHSRRWPIPMCWFGVHRPLRGAVVWDGIHYVSHCRDCGSPLRRHDNGWRKDWLEPERAAAD